MKLLLWANRLFTSPSQNWLGLSSSFSYRVFVKVEHSFHPFPSIRMSPCRIRVRKIHLREERESVEKSILHLVVVVLCARKVKHTHKKRSFSFLLASWLLCFPNTILETNTPMAANSHSALNRLFSHFLTMVYLPHHAMPSCIPMPCHVMMETKQERKRNDWRWSLHN